MMGLTAPLMALGAALIAVPIWLHLAFKPLTGGRKLPSLMFLKAHDLKVKRQRRLRDIPLLLLRIALLIALALAFAGPFSESEPGAGGTAATVLVVDVSASMEVADGMRAAKEVARDALRTRAGPIALVSAGATTTQLSDFGAGRQALAAAIDNLAALPERGDLYAAVAFAGRKLGEDFEGQGDIVVISDLQRSAWPAAQALVQLPGVRVEVVPVSAGPAANLALQRVALSGDQRTLEIEIANTGGVSAGGRELTVVAGSHTLHSEFVSLDAGVVRTVSIPVTLAPDREITVTATLSEDALAYDNESTVILPRTRELRVALMGSAATSAQIHAALAEVGSPTLNVAGGATPARLRNGQTDLVVAENPPADRLAEPLPAFVAGGGALLLLADDAETLAGLAGVWGASKPADAQGQQASPVGLASAARALRMDAQSSIPALTESASVLARLGTTHGLKLNAPDGAQPLMYWNSGEVAAFRAAEGPGQVLVFGMSTARGVLARQPEVAPLLQALVREAVSVTSVPQAYLAGAVVEPRVLDTAGTEGNSSQLLVTPDGEQRPLDSDRDIIAPEMPGVYTVTGQGGEWQFAVRPDPAESELERMTAEEFQSLVAATPPAAASGTAEAARTPVRHPWWWPVLLMVLLLAALETVSAALRRGARLEGAR